MQFIRQPKSVENAQTVSADEFSADAMSRILSSFPHRDWNVVPPQPNAERETSEAAADDRDFLLRS